MSSERPALGELLELLHRADAPFTSVQASYRIWRHDTRAHAAFVAQAEAEKRRGASISMIGVAGEREGAIEHRETVRIWRAGDRVREEHDGGRRDGYYGVRRGDLWWRWDPSAGAISNESDPRVGSGIGEQLSVMLDPTPLLGSLRFTVLGRSEVAGRATILADAVPRVFDPRRRPRGFELGQLGGGAERYTLDVDSQLGVLLRVVASRASEPFHEITTMSITFDQPLGDQLFAFEPPAGEQIRAAGQGPRPQHLTTTEAQQRAPFTVLLPDRVPESWHVHCVFVEATQRPAFPASVNVNYRSDDGHESVSLSETSSADGRERYQQHTRGDAWEEVLRDGTTVHVTKPGSRGPQAQAHIERAGTFVFLTSENLNSDQLATIAASLKPAASTSSI